MKWKQYIPMMQMSWSAWRPLTLSLHESNFSFSFYFIHLWAPLLQHKETGLESGWAVEEMAIQQSKFPLGLGLPQTLFLPLTMFEAWLELDKNRSYHPKILQFWADACIWETSVNSSLLPFPHLSINSILPPPQKNPGDHKNLIKLP